MGLLESVAERYDHRTNSIVTEVDEFILSLEDMVRLTGLRVTGRPVTGLVHSDYTSMMVELVGSMIVMYKPCLFLTSSAVHRVEDSRETAIEPGEDADHQLHAFLLVLFEDLLFSHTSSWLSAVFLPLHADLGRVREYAWGAASLSYLYSVLFRFSDGSSR